MSFFDSADDDPRRANRRPLLFFVLVTVAVGASASVQSRIRSRSVSSSTAPLCQRRRAGSR